MFGGAFGALAGLSYSHTKTYGAAFEIEPASIGTLAGLVSITAACANIGIWEGALAGFIGGLLACASKECLEYLHIDDPVGAIPVHGVAGFWGLLAVGLFHRDGGYGPATLPGLFHGGDATLMGVQLAGGIAIIAWGAAGTWALLQVSRCCFGLRVTRSEEELGLDIAEHAVNTSVALRMGATERPAAIGRIRRAARRAARGLADFSRRRLGTSVVVPPTPTRDGVGNIKVEEYIEDVGQAAGVGFAARRAAAKWRSAVKRRRAAQPATPSKKDLEEGSAAENASEALAADEDFHDDESVAAAGVMASMSP